MPYGPSQAHKLWELPLVSRIGKPLLLLHAEVRWQRTTVVPLQLGKMSFWPPIQNSEIIFPLEAVFSMATGFQDVLCFVYISIKWIQYWPLFLIAMFLQKKKKKPKILYSIFPPIDLSCILKSEATQALDVDYKLRFYGHLYHKISLYSWSNLLNRLNDLKYTGLCGRSF